MPRTIELADQRFGRLLVLRRDHSRRGRGYWICRCDCGEERSVLGTRLRSSKTQSCGCLNRELLLKIRTKHGGKGSAEYRCWMGMRSRCCNPRNASFYRYGGRGLQRQFESFEEFLAEVGPRPSARHSIDRIDNNGHYTPGNIRWALAKPQARNRASNRLITHDGRSQCLAEWAEEAGLPYRVLQYRISEGWSVERALMTPVAARSPRQRKSHDSSRMESKGGSR